jgi:hypothetical protein
VKNAGFFRGFCSVRTYRATFPLQNPLQFAIE